MTRHWPTYQVMLTRFINHSRTLHLTGATIIMIVVALFSNQGFAQDYKKLMTDLQKKNANADKLHIVMLIHAYEDETSTAPFYKDKAVIRKSGHNCLYSVANNEMLLNEHYMVMVDKELKQISCTRRDVKSEEKFNSEIKLNMDSILSAYGTPAFIGRKNQTEQYRLLEPQTSVKSIDLFINTAQGVIEKMEYRYDDGQFVRIIFEVFEVNAQISDAIFAEEQYVKIVNGKIIPAPAFQKYELASENF